MSRKPNKSNGFTFANARPKKPGAARGAINKALPIPLPGPIPTPDKLIMDLGTVLDASEIAAIKKAEQIVIHVVGDTGGVRDGAAEETLIAEKMEGDFSGDAKDHPAFFYHLGDVVYYNGEVENYPTQFLRPYQFYPAPIFAIAGNHDSSPNEGDEPGKLDQFMKIFCAGEPEFIEKDFDRKTMTQPYLYFTLESPFVKIIGLYSNSSEGPGLLNPANSTEQLEFLEAEFTRAKKAQATDDRAVLVAVHHPLFSISNDHGASPAMLKQVDDLMEKTGFIPDAFLSGHVHGFELFIREYQGREIPYIICGTGGYNNDAHVKQQFRLPATFSDGFTLAQFFDHQYGYMRVTIDARYFAAEYVGVDKSQNDPRTPTNVLESFSLDLKTHKVSTF